jgi:hypothetical protein
VTIFGHKVGRVWGQGRYWLMVYKRPLVVQLVNGSTAQFGAKPLFRIPLPRRRGLKKI